MRLFNRLTARRDRGGAAERSKSHRASGALKYANAALLQSAEDPVHELRLNIVRLEGKRYLGVWLLFWLFLLLLLHLASSF